jgi:hypothetical protein
LSLITGGKNLLKWGGPISVIRSAMFVIPPQLSRLQACFADFSYLVV